MASTIKIRRSATPGQVPTTVQLALGELAINTYDGKLFLKKSVSGVESIVDVTSGGGTATPTATGMDSIAASLVFGGGGGDPNPWLDLGTSLSYSGTISLSSTQASTSTTTGTIVLGGGIGIGGAAYIGSTLNAVGAITQNGSQVLHAGNYNSYAPTLTGTGASGTWGINITGNATNITGTYGGTITSSQVTTALGYTPLSLAGGTLTGDLIGTTATFSGSVTSGGNTGFNNATYSVGVRNPIWYFGNASTYGISYFQGTAGIGGLDTIGIHPNGTATATGSSFAVSTSNAYVNNNIVLHAANYNSYAPTLTGTGASGTWGINVTGNAGSATILQTTRTINGTSFNGSSNITTNSWGTSRTITIGATGKAVDGSAAVSWTVAEVIGTTSSTQVSSLGVGVAASGTAGEILATGNVTAYYSDAKLKEFLGRIPNALAKVQKLSGYYYVENEVAKSLGYNNDRLQVGVSAQEVQAVLPEVVTKAPIGDEYLTVWYDKLVPLLIEAIKELNDKVDYLTKKVDNV